VGRAVSFFRRRVGTPDRVLNSIAPRIVAPRIVAPRSGMAVRRVRVVSFQWMPTFLPKSLTALSRTWVRCKHVLISSSILHDDRPSCNPGSARRVSPVDACDERGGSVSPVAGRRFGMQEISPLCVCSCTSHGSGRHRTASRGRRLRAPCVRGVMEPRRGVGTPSVSTVLVASSAIQARRGPSTTDDPCLPRGPLPLVPRRALFRPIARAFERPSSEVDRAPTDERSSLERSHVQVPAGPRPTGRHPGLGPDGPAEPCRTHPSEGRHLPRAPASGRGDRAPSLVAAVAAPTCLGTCMIGGRHGSASQKYGLLSLISCSIPSWRIAP